MKRSLLIFSALAVLAFAAGAAAYWCGMHWCEARASRSEGELGWLRTEFRLGEGEMVRIRALHERYLPKCREYCQQIAEKRVELRAALQSGSGVTTDAEAKLAEIGALQARCQAAMLRHFFEVSHEMPSGQGRRYLEEMQRLTLGAHDRVERGMAAEDSHHGHH